MKLTDAEIRAAKINAQLWEAIWKKMDQVATERDNHQTVRALSTFSLVIAMQYQAQANTGEIPE